MVGDAKTVENVMKFYREVSDRELSFEQASIYGEVFMDALSVVMILPVDWHAGLAMLLLQQAIYMLFWDGLLELFKDLLHWQRVKKDVRGCYFQACRLMNYVAEELIRIFLYEFASKFPEFDEDTDDAAEYICNFVTEFNKFLIEMSNGDDEWRRAWALFIFIALDFTSFVNTYRNGDAIMVEYGYKRFAPIWQMLCQHKYVERHWHQIETL